jgi:hypothetical protein
MKKALIHSYIFMTDGSDGGGGELGRGGGGNQSRKSNQDQWTGHFTMETFRPLGLLVLLGEKYSLSAPRREIFF